MKSVCFSVCTVFLVLSAVFASPVSAEKAENGLTLYVLSDGSVSEETLERIVAFTELNMAFDTQARRVRSTAKKGDSLIAAGEAVLPRIPSDSAATVFFTEAGVDEDSHTVFDHENKLAVVHVSKVTAGADEKTAYLRLERLAMRGFGFLLGQQQAIDPFSVMAPYQTVEQLDRMGRNFSPPDLVKLQKDAQAMGLRFMTNSPFSLAPPVTQE